MDDIDIIKAHALGYADAILQGDTEPYTGAKALWRMRSELAGLTDALVVFVGLASEWEDHPEQRADLEREITVEADRFRARFGK